ncbi:hypothetical protein [Pedobacter sp. L105]|uniref:transglutaminase domain-containing protein n=1 Tax=Pedobacter sp. L105 TaxID=1641871 RepID=UPI00131EC264|nr:hypothetical protein [Pedobacter sp. L105]
MKSFFVYLLLLSGLSSSLSAASAGTRDSIDFVAILKKTGPYNPSQNQNYPSFTYQSPDAPELAVLRKTYHLDSIAGKGSETDRAIRLLDWFHRQVPHEDVASIDELTAGNIITFYKEKKVGQGCYPLSIAMNEIFLSMGFKSRSVICFSNLYPVAQGGHVINSLYIDSLKKWIYMDPQENAYLKDEKGNFLSIAEVRERLINGMPLILNPTANYHQIPTKKEEYLYQFMAQHIYRMICPLNSECNSQTRSDGKLLQYVELLPSGSIDPLTDGFETSARKNYQVITYHTNNDLLFWQKP